MLSLEVHVVELRCQNVLEVRRVLRYLLLVLLFGDHIEGPASVQLRNQVHTFRVVDPVLLPALNEFVFEFLGFFRKDVRTLFEVATNQLLVDHALRRVTHYYYIN